MKKERFLLITILSICTVAANAQQKPASRQQDSLTQQFARRTGIKKEKAVKIREAYNYKQEELTKLMRDTVMKPAMRQEQIKKLLVERRIRLNIILTPGLKDSLQKSGMDDGAGYADRLKEMRSRQQEKLNAVPHVSHQRLRKDSINTNPGNQSKTKTTQP